jgi:putative PIN family toxin of toxin-antitoxin system
MTALVIDTNWVLDLWVFQDPRARALSEALAAGAVTWWVCPGMRTELDRVLTYRNVAKTLALRQITPIEVGAHFDRWAHQTSIPLPSGIRCVDPDDQVFVDLAVAQQAVLLSKDDHLLRLRKRLLERGVRVSTTWPLAA